VPSLKKPALFGWEWSGIPAAAMLLLYMADAPA
jgi:hypothetical protein